MIDCQTCGKPATCFGEHDGRPAHSCDGCCGHDDKTGWCEPLPSPTTTDEEVPVAVLFAVWSGEMRIGPNFLRCHVLDNGRRVIDAEDMAKLIMWMESPGDWSETCAADMEAFTRRAQGAQS